MLVSDEKAVYHVMSRTALDGFPLADVEKDFLLGLIKRFSGLYFTEILGFCLMGNHFHLLVQMVPDHRYSDKDILQRQERVYGRERCFEDDQIGNWREKLSSLSEFVREIKVGFARYYNRRYNRRGYFWGDRFKSLIVQKGETLDQKVLKKERKNDFHISRTDRFIHRTRYFSDSGIIGSKEFVSTHYKKFKHLFQSKHEKKPKPVKGLEGLFSLKRFSENI